MPIEGQVLVLLAFSLFAVLKNMGWVFDLFSHFHIQYAFLALGYLIYFSWAKYKQAKVLEGQPDLLMWVIVAVVTLCINLVMILPVFLDLYQPKPQMPEDGQKISILLFNVSVENKNTQGVLDLAEEYHPDIVTLQEVWGTWPERLRQTDLKQIYPYQAFDSLRGNLILSKFPILATYVLTDQNQKNSDHAQLGMSVLETIVQLPDGQEVELLNMHPSVPVFAYATQNQHYMEWMNQSAKQSIQENRPLIVYGDFNTTVFSTYYQTLLHQSGLHNAREGFGLMPTWPSIFPPLWIGIDHVLLSHHFKTGKFETGPFVGSDHLPVYVELTLKPEKRYPVK